MNSQTFTRLEDRFRPYRNRHVRRNGLLHQQEKWPAIEGAPCQINSCRTLCFKLHGCVSCGLDDGFFEKSVFKSAFNLSALTLNLSLKFEIFNPRSCSLTPVHAKSSKTPPWPFTM